jgi:DNA-binding NtrC family response regulator
MNEEKEKISLLLVDDEVEFLDAVVGPVSRRGFEVTKASNGSEALDHIANSTFDVVVLDVKMPGIDGTEVFSRIKDLAPDLPVILLTGHGTVQQAFETSRSGVFEYLTKPCDIEILADTALRAARHKADIESVSLGSEGGIRVLLVDDDVDFLDALSPALGRRGISVTTARDADEAVKRINEQTFDVALIDLRMPDINGLDLFDLIGWKQPSMEVLILTGYPSSDGVLEAFKKRVFDFLIKPQDVDVISAKIHQAFEHKRARTGQE